MTWYKIMQSIPFKMAPFSSFTVTRRSLVPDVSQQVIEPEEKELPEGLFEKGDGTFEAKCRRCNNYYEILCASEEFTQDMSYCGGSQYCAP